MYIGPEGGFGHVAAALKKKQSYILAVGFLQMQLVMIFTKIYILKIKTLLAENIEISAIIVMKQENK